MSQAARILLVDDEASIQRALAPLLRSRGYDVAVATTGEEALAAVRSQAPDLIVLDLGLPDIEGTEICRRVRAESAVPIVVLSARGGESDKVSVLDIGADDYVTKPFGPEELLARIRVALRRADASRHPESDLGPQRSEPAGTPLGPHGTVEEKGRTRSGASALPPQRTVGRLSFRDSLGPFSAAIRRGFLSWTHGSSSRCPADPRDR